MKKNRMVVTVLAILGVILIGLGTTFAFTGNNNTSKKTNDITTSNTKNETTEKEEVVVAEETNSNIISVSSLKATTDEEGKIQTKYLEFTITPNVKDNSKVSYDITTKEKDNKQIYNQIKVYLTSVKNVDNQIIEEPLVLANYNELSEMAHDSIIEKLIYNVSIDSNSATTQTYRLRMWTNNANTTDLNNGEVYNFVFNTYENIQEITEEKKDDNKETTDKNTKEQSTQEKTTTTKSNTSSVSITNNTTTTKKTTTTNSNNTSNTKTNTNSTSTSQNTNTSTNTNSTSTNTNTQTQTNTNTNNTNSQSSNTNTIDLTKIISDKEIIPDKYNTGASGNLTKYAFGDDLGGLFVLLSGVSDEPLPTINFLFAQNQQSNYVIENIDFTDYFKIQFISYAVPNKVKITFKNCKFKYIAVAQAIDDNISFEFNNCTIETFGGSNATFNHCKFGKGSEDSINAYKNVIVKNSYISDIAAYNSTKELHYDGVQIFGLSSNSNFLVQNIHFYNTRFETPYIREVRDGVQSKSYVNAPIMLQLEFGNATDISFENVYVNGGGYSVYSTVLKNKPYTYSDVSFKNVKIGYAHLFGELYEMKPGLEAKTEFTNFGHYDSLYVSSVWKDNNGIHVITTNDTLVERKLTCETDNGKYNFTIQAHPKLTMDNSANYKFSDMPYDIDKTINDKDAKFIKCYDTTSTDTLSETNLIRTQKF